MSEHRRIVTAKSSDLDSWVYAIGPEGLSIVKIGLATNVTERLRYLQTAHYLTLTLRWTTPGLRELEQELHVRFAPLRLRGEWFDFGNADPVTSIREAVEAIGREGGAYELWRERRKEARRQRSALRYVR